MEYTLEDALDYLKDIEMDRLKEIDDLINTFGNNDVIILNSSCNSEDLRRMQHKLCYSLLNKIREEEPKDYPFPMTSDLHVETLKELEQAVQNAQELLTKTESDFSRIQEDISYLEKKKLGLQKMKEAYLGAAETASCTTYNAEYSTVKRIFRDVKTDLSLLVNTLYPDNDDCQNFFADLAEAYTRGGDGIYLNVTPEITDFANFLFEAGVATYHRNDKNKVKMSDML